MSDGPSNRCVSVTKRVAAPPEVVFAILQDPARHVEIDGSGTVVAAVESQQLRLGSRFGMKMRMGLPYRIGNEVVEFEQDRRIAWRHMGHHVWRYELTPLPDGGTEVTESFDWSKARVPKALELVGAPERNRKAIVATLERLDDVATADAAGA